MIYSKVYSKASLRIKISVTSLGGLPSCDRYPCLCDVCELYWTYYNNVHEVLLRKRYDS